MYVSLCRFEVYFNGKRRVNIGFLSEDDDVLPSRLKHAYEESRQEQSARRDAGVDDLNGDENFNSGWRRESQPLIAECSRNFEEEE